MKKTSIIALAIIAIAIGAIVSMYGDASTYEGFEVSANNPGKEFHVVGVLNREKEKYYDPQKDANYFSFYLIDEKGKESKVVYHNPEPADFDRSEKVVIVGSMEGDHFEASKILLKCPSKYTDNQVQT
ncbi:MAG: cytochrome c maturation protein CcmE [Bacteroidia bacterium]|nr:cytochrome c maturation protein CcmE [Bacteroidia bacterium]MCF8428032.1 cytochrome c maturation protein CcmE [Bacteroidia bacterium]MCF8448210.1 cytochrome c maturation protein CcmE [Bacteroidia bacterium]